ncbi:MAG: biotin--[acetyl-CoA-carboxylase] ligase [Tissierellia bacterium]|nr:biotin--[acetyl-CoA-carboxylase] ligase [Tissierellia bacterium]
MNRLIGKEVFYFESLDSTNEYMLNKAGTLDEGSCVFCDFQTKGRGRQGRDWLSLSGKGLYFSFLLKPSISLEEIPKLTIAVGVGISKALDSLGINTMIKWPNDIYLNGKKLSGILSELKILDGEANVVVGVGLNIAHDRSDFPDDISNKATSLLIETGENFNKGNLLDILLDFIDREYTYFLTKGVDFDYLSKKDFLFGKKARYLGKDVIIRGISKDCSLLIEDDRGVRGIEGGEIEF